MAMNNVIMENNSMVNCF